MSKLFTSKNERVLPPRKTPYLILLCLARSSALSILASIRSIVKKAAKLAVYDEITISAKNHQIPAASRVETALKNKVNLLQLFCLIIFAIVEF